MTFPGSWTPAEGAMPEGTVLCTGPEGSAPSAGVGGGGAGLRPVGAGTGQEPGDVWSGRAQLYVESDAHREGEDLELLVRWAEGAATALDVATGGGQVARRLRELGIKVVTVDPAPGMNPDVISRAEELPFADDSFDVVACRTAAHHFADVTAAVREMARVSGERVLVVDTLNMGERGEMAEVLRDPSHVRNYTEAEWRKLVGEASLRVDEVRVTKHTIDFEAWLRRTGCEGDDAERVRELWGDRVVAGRLTLDKIAIRALKGGA